jgi:hypothetical protein
MEQENINEIVRFFFTLQLNIKLYHWNTNSYSRHKATDQLGQKILELSDKFVEVFIGKYKVKPMIHKIKIVNDFITDDGSEILLRKSAKYLEELHLKINDTELLNIRDEILGELQQTLYLYQLK